MDIVFYDYINSDLPKEHFCKKENKKGGMLIGQTAYEMHQRV